MSHTDKIDFDDITGLEAQMYNQFIRLWGVRERVNDIVNPVYHPIGDIQLPRNSVFHYQAQLPGDTGPSNSAAFIANYDRRINIYFYPTFDVVQGTVKNVVFQMSKAIKQYESGHFNFQRVRDYNTVITKEGELLVNNMAMAQVPIVYRRLTVFSPFQKRYNELYNLINAANLFAQHNVHQFAEFKLPKSFPTYRKLEDCFRRYEKFFKDGEVVKYEKEAIRVFQADNSFWLLDLFGILIGGESAQYSQFNRLSDKAKEQFNFIFTYEGKCWIVNLKVLMSLLEYGIKPEELAKGTPEIKYRYFKRFYLALVNLVTPISEAVLEEENGTTKEEPVEPSQPAEGKDRLEVGQEKSRGSSKNAPVVDPNPSPSSLADLYASVPKSSDKLDTTGQGETEKVNQGNNDTPRDEATPDEIWGTDVDDEVFEQATVENAVIVAGEEEYGPTATINRQLKEKVAKGQISTKELEYFTSISQAYKDIEFGGKTLEEIVDIKPQDMVIKKEDSIIAPDSPIINDKAVLQSRTTTFSKGYQEKFLERDIFAAVLGVQNAGIALLDLNRESVITADSKYDVFTMKLQPVLEGGQSTRRFRIPKVDDDGTFMINGVKSYAQDIRIEIPVRKIGKTKVSLTSYYDKKIMVERSPYSANDFAKWLKNNITKRSTEDNSLTVVIGKYQADQKDVCWYYSVLASRFKEIVKDDLVFNFDTPNLIGDNKDWKKLCNGDTWVIGLKDGNPILIDNTGLVTIDGYEKGYIEEILGLPMSKAPVPDSTIYINGYKFPSVVVLSYWMGFSNLMERLKPNFRVVDPNQRPNLGPNEYLIQFADERLILDRRDGLATLILSGLRSLPEIANFSRTQLDDPNVWFSIMRDPRVKPSHFNEMKLMFDMFIDHITARELKRRKYPVVMDELIITAIEMLLNNEASHEVEITEQRFVGYERFAGHVYREVVKASRQFRNKPGGNKKTFDFNPEAVMMAILTDSSHQNCEEVNPAHQLKEQEEVTFGGSFGRSDQAMVRRTRGQLPNYEGIISEAGKDSGKVGFVSYKTSDAKIVDYAGNVDVNLKTTDPGRGSITANLLYGTTVDDPKRALFSGVQLSQWMATNSYQANPLRTPYDSMVAYRTSELYSSIAKNDGKVIEVTPEGMKVEYTDGTMDSFSLGYEVGKAAGENHKHLKVTDFKVGQTFTKGTILAFDETFFVRDAADPTRVNIKLGTMTRIALMEEQFTFEDSIGITKSYSVKNTTPYLKVHDFKAGYEQNVKMFVKVGDIVSYDQILAEVQDEGSGLFDDDLGQSMAGLDRLGIKQHKAKQPGKVVKIDVLYNGDPDDASPSIRTIIKKADSFRGKQASFKKNTASTGDVGGNTSVGKTKIYPGTVVINIYIENNIITTIADKFVCGNQMKGTVGFIYEQQIYTVDGREVDMVFSLKSLLNRMVLSMRDKLVANEVNFVYTSRMISKYGRYE